MVTEHGAAHSAFGGADEIGAEPGHPVKLTARNGTHSLMLMGTGIGETYFEFQVIGSTSDGGLELKMIGAVSPRASRSAS